MGWLTGETRGPRWKQGWMDQTISTATLPPPSLLAIFAIVFLLMSLSGYNVYKKEMQRRAIGFRLLMFFLPLAILVVARFMFQNGGRIMPSTHQRNVHRPVHGTSPWGVGAVLVVLLFMISYQSYFKSGWFPSLWT
ncbi:hypothetical protein ZOSMA_12G00060 [Zostera marina]|uniref:Uncharacterized protein n=1 Tax=Zostera marina TaxID=29655 RepID=A0A0K9PZ31_ZOSMR|nr:hypothetical protein ZOSMA_12G00060 [Zostera marina]